MKVTLKEFRQVVRKMVNEYVADTACDPNKDEHPDPTAATWDSGLDEVDVDEKKKPKFADTYCSSCGGSFGPGDHGFSHCESHKGKKNLDDDD
jgi:hypothetical protein